MDLGQISSAKRAGVDAKNPVTRQGQSAQARVAVEHRTLQSLDSEIEEVDRDVTRIEGRSEAVLQKRTFLPVGRDSVHVRTVQDGTPGFRYLYVRPRPSADVLRPEVPDAGDVIAF